MNKDSRTFPKLQGFTTRSNLSLSLNKWGLCLDHLQHWLGKELWKKGVDHQEAPLSTREKGGCLEIRLQLICQSSTSHFAPQQWNCTLVFEPRVGARDAEGTRRLLRSFERKPAARKTVSSLYVRVQDLLLRHSGTAQNLVPKHEGKSSILCNIHGNDILYIKWNLGIHEIQAYWMDMEVWGVTLDSG